MDSKFYYYTADSRFNYVPITPRSYITMHVARTYYYIILIHRIVCIEDDKLHKIKNIPDDAERFIRLTVYIRICMYNILGRNVSKKFFDARGARLYSHELYSSWLLIFDISTRFTIHSNGTWFS